MCGIVGTLNLRPHRPIERHTLRQMLGMLRHRGPDEFGIYRDADVGLGSARLSIIDLSGGQQPITNEDQTLWIVFNGEIYNYVELRPRLERRGHQFTTNTDTEVLLHLYEEYGPTALDFLNGQFALAIWDAQAHSLFLARDRLGIRPLFYTMVDGRLIFGSEVKAILAHPDVHAEIDRTALQQVFTYWSTLSPSTVFEDIQEIPPANYLTVTQGGDIEIQPYWELDFAPFPRYSCKENITASFEELLTDAVRLRLRADVPVGAYLSGGLDSSVTTSLIRHRTSNRLETFSIAFDDSVFDESTYQMQMADYLGTDHEVVHCSYRDIGEVFPDVIWHTETPVLRASPAPMFLLSKLVHDQGFKVVLTGEGADEILAGYNIFKEMKVRRFWARDPGSEFRPMLLQRLYPYIPGFGGGGGTYLRAYFKQNLEDVDMPTYSHALRWLSTARLQRFLVENGLGTAHETSVSLPTDFDTWSPLARAQFLEMTIFLPQYLLSSQGDRMAMAHSVEGRFPFLDHRVVEFCNHLPSDLKLRGLQEKWLLKQVGKRLVPEEIWRRTKQPYRAPISRCFYGKNPPDYVQTLLSLSALQESGLFKPPAVMRLLQKSARGIRLSEMDEMALIGILSTQLVYWTFVRDFNATPLSEKDDIKVIDRVHAFAGEVH